MYDNRTLGCRCRIGPALPLARISDHPDTPRPPLAEAEVKFVGDPIALVIAESRYLAEDAVDLVDVDYDPRPADRFAIFAPLIRNAIMVRRAILGRGLLPLSGRAILGRDSSVQPPRIPTLRHSRPP